MARSAVIGTRYVGTVTVTATIATTAGLRVVGFGW